MSEKQEVSGYERSDGEAVKETLLSLLVSIGCQSETIERQIDLTYAPCRELYDAAVRSKRPEDMRRVLHVCKPFAQARTDE